MTLAELSAKNVNYYTRKVQKIISYKFGRSLFKADPKVSCSNELSEMQSQLLFGCARHSHPATCRSAQSNATCRSAQPSRHMQVSSVKCHM